MPSK
jgi:hypothetical protein